MLQFKDVTLADKELITSFTLHSLWQSCDLSFSNLYSWWFLYRTQYALKDEYLLFRFYSGTDLVYLMPIGTGPLKPILESLLEDARLMRTNFQMLGISFEMRTQMEEVMPGSFTFKENRDFYDYIYLREDLAGLTGKKYQAKRNFLNKFRKEYPHYEYYELTPEWIPSCLNLAKKWRLSNGEDTSKALEAEALSMSNALGHLQELNLSGGVLIVEKQVIAFTYGAPINQDTWDICVEKADTNFDGAYAMINYEYVNRIDKAYTYINREEDLGIPGLRKAKLSYQPYLLLEKYIAELT